MGRNALYLTQEIARQYDDVNVRILDSYGPGVPALMPLYFFKCFIHVGLLCLMRRADVLHLNLAAHGSTVRKLLLMRLAQVFGVPTLLHIHASKFIPFCESLAPQWKKLLIESLSRASCIVVIGDFWRRYLVDSLGIREDIVTVIHNAVPLPAMAEPRRTNDRCRIVALGMLGPRKGTPELLDALAAPPMRSLEWDAVIAGNGTVDEARTRAEALGISSRIEIPGWVDGVAVAKILATADVFVLPSHNEGLPMAILEAMGAAVPVVTTPVGAIPELVVAETGILVNPGCAAELAEALAKLVSNPALRTQLGTNGRERVKQHFRIEVTAARFVGIYRALSTGTAVPSISSNSSR
jgi:glycosyltransferase involved in cell wall biosynthesis